MATKTSKRAGESSTTVSVGIRIDPKIKFALDIMGRLQKRSLTAVIEWSISQAIANQATDFDGGTLASSIDKIWSTDEAVRMVNLAINMPEALTYDELRVWETIRSSAYFWDVYPDGSFGDNFNRLELNLIRSHWALIQSHVEKHKSSPTVVPMYDHDFMPDDIPF
ncbi:hypothetical protein BK649_05885 [Pseudomonas canadensis]|uniref:Uncharacterized protein n=2 Tax=Pseudomonas TaxID=286 RepID=A0A423FFZ9_9PSED|nr:MULTISPECIES: hypothetical protein [Pseudomonas]ROM56488.1 hypothetical protein BK649_05885 [Pseudomonas canadensis]TYK56898.1 hypothetical protein FXO26_17910 [Pseudomonas synxantha]